MREQFNNITYTHIYEKARNLQQLLQFQFDPIQLLTSYNRSHYNNLSLFPLWY